MTSGASATNSRRVSANAVGTAGGPANIEAHIAPSMKAKLRMIKEELRQRMHQSSPVQGRWLRRDTAAASADRR